MTSQIWWYTARAGGIVAWALLTASVVWGLLLSSRLKPLGAPAPWTLDLHRFLGGLATIFVGVHVTAILLDSYTSFGVSDVLVPFASSWQPVEVAWGVVGFYLLLAVELTSLARRRLPKKVWRYTHMLSLPLFAFATIHFLVTGTDATSVYALVTMAVATLAVGTLLTRRLTQTRTRACSTAIRRTTRSSSEVSEVLG